MLNFFKKKDDTNSSTNIPGLGGLGLNKTMMISALKQMRHLNPAQKQQVKLMFKKQIKRDISKEEITKGAEELGKQLQNEFSPEEIELMKKDLIDIFGN